MNTKFLFNINGGKELFDTENQKNEFVDLMQVTFGQSGFSTHEISEHRKIKKMIKLERKDERIAMKDDPDTILTSRFMFPELVNEESFLMRSNQSTNDNSGQPIGQNEHLQNKTNMASLVMPADSSDDDDESIGNDAEEAAV